MRFSRIAAVALSAALAMSVAACGDDDEPAAAGKFPAGSTMEKLSKAGKLKVGTKFDQPLFGLKGLDGKPAGFDVEIAKVIAGELGIKEDKIEWIESKSADREPFIEQGKVDLVVATYTINDTRKQKVSFAGPYFVAGQDILVRKDETAISGPESFQAGDKKVCSVTGSTPAKNIETYLKDKAAQLVLFDVYSKCLDALKNKQVDAVTTDNVILSGYQSKEPDAVKVLGQPFTREPYGIGLTKDDKVFRDWINDLLEAAFKDGRYKKAWDASIGTLIAIPASLSVVRY
ncbi:glutamate transport system substrate-binding protein [Allocatelliglobosispora scoriae]|uniref:Glutamate transport system substrate-binding protein n=1 Tax=Allocatelliglobosispora scoriae TaxID=643052 RepID=A0A841BZV9_9ACTN|nr:glutamate ABC transporter substrate-binding protein [Allocatelliglobosispora scoriae]MBB5872332.1 glutamate transport system substrate-binding protein [Allocatelliglobosispora scoriae]